ncbi:probable RNA-dependent RNA polymerase [Wheat yellow striate virus]|uniref:Replicase n=1 Tax=Wheat yellow striate virus TaxID=2152660 RepID=A0A2R4K2I6_9RHAB|nr:probable RNA-dependent RNA polymerase [Wheat yellow striate virus]AVV48080.1 probable RNA-dependent RNA polymerase [Wheat yellow striate virus]
MDVEEPTYWAHDEDDDYWWDADEYLGEEEEDEIYEDTEDELVEGGDFHLKSALRGEEDMLQNPIYKKERDSMVEELGSLGTLMNHIDVVSMLNLIGTRVAQDKRPSGGHTFLHEGGFNIIPLQENVKLIKAELMSVLPEMAGMNIDQVLSGSYHLFMADHPYVTCTISTVLFILSVLNNVKNIRQGIEVGTLIGRILYRKGNLVCLSLAAATLCYLSTDILVFDVDGSRHYMPKTYFLNGCDKVQERFNIMLYSYMAESLGVPGSCPSQIVKRTISWGDNVLANMGNEGYNVIGLYEAILVGMILDRDDEALSPTPRSESFLSNILTGLSSEEQGYAKRLITTLQDMSPAQLADLHGLYRIWGHPIIDIDGGVRKLQRVTREEKGDINAKPESRETVRSFRRLFTTEYFKKHSIYPPMEITSKFNTYLGNCIRTGKEIDEKHINYQFSDWDYIELQETFSIPYSWNVLHLAKDKAISPTRNEIYNMLLSKGRIFNAELRRGVLKLMTTTLIPLRDFLKKVASDGLDIDDCIIGLFPKERELKILARFFALLSFNMRLYFTSTEELLGSKLLKYFPQITMSSNLLEMQEKMASMSKELRTQNRSVTYVINMDFVKWNQQMRESTCRGVFTELDKLFGLKGLYTRSHQIFKDSVLYIADGTRRILPDPISGVMIDDNACWTDDGAGKEGIRQKAWTIMTVCDIAAVARHHPGKFHLVGGGDNQVLTITYHTNQVDTQGVITEAGKQKIKSKVKRFLTDLEKHFSERGLPLKTTETWCSTSLFMYNKYMYYQGSPLRSPLKQVSRLFPFSNNTSMTLQSMAQCLGTGLRSVAQKELSHIPALMMRNIWGSILTWIVTVCHPMLLSISNQDSLKGDGIITRGKKEIKMKVESVESAPLALKIIYLPGHFGGPGLVNLLQMTMRGFPDPITEGIYFLMAMKKNTARLGSAYTSLFQRMAGVSFSRSRNYEPLVEDVCSLNTDAPRSGTSEQREVARKILLKSKLGGNENLRDLLRIMEGDNEKNFYKALTASRVLDIRVLHEIASATLYAITNTFTSRVDRTATLKRLTLRYSMIKSLAESERKFLRYLLVRDLKQHDIMFEKCSRVTADECRTLGWGKQIIGVTVATPFEYLSVSLREKHVCDGNNIIVRLSSSGNKKQLGEVLGPCKPYLGTYTKEKFKMTEVAAAYGDEDVLTKALRIMKIINWRFPEGSTMSEILKAPFRAVTDIDPQRMIQESSVTKGDYDHRRKMDSRVHGGIPNFVITPLSHMSICTSTWYKHARGGKNENIHFQACIIQTMYKIVMLLMNNGKCDEIIHAHESCSTCICEITEPVLDLVTPMMDLIFPQLQNNSLVYIPEQAISFDHSRMKEVDYARRVGMLDCHRDTDYTWLDTYSSLSWLIMCDVIGWTRMPHSFYFMIQNDVDHYLLSMYLICLWKVMRKEFELINTQLDWEPMIKVYSTQEGITVLSNQMGLVVGGSLEGGLEVDMKDICSAFNTLTITQIPPFSVNLALPKIHKQVAAWWMLMDDNTLLCIDCHNNLNGYWDGTSINRRVDNDLRCYIHADGDVSPRIINAHISNLSQGLIRLTPGGTSQSHPIIIGGDKLNNLETVPSVEDEWPDVESITLLNQIGETNDIDGRLRFIIESMSVIMPDIVVVRPDMLDITLVKTARELLKCDDGSKLIIYILVEEPSYLESGTIYEMERAFPNSETVDVQFDYRKAPGGLHKLWINPREESIQRVEVGDWICISFTDLIKHHDSILADTVLTMKERRLGRQFLVNKGVGSFKPGDLGKYIFSSELNMSYKQSRQVDYEINKVMIQNPTLGGKFMILKRRCSWALFSSRYEMLRAVERIKKNMTVEGRSTKTKEWSKTHQDDVLILIISMLMRADEKDESEIFTLGYVNCDVENLVMYPKFSSTQVVSLRYLDYFWFFKRMYEYQEKTFAIPYTEIRTSLNIGSPKRSGYNTINSSE